MATSKLVLACNRKDQPHPPGEDQEDIELKGIDAVNKQVSVEFSWWEMRLKESFEIRWRLVEK